MYKHIWSYIVLVTVFTHMKGTERIYILCICTVAIPLVFVQSVIEVESWTETTGNQESRSNPRTHSCSSPFLFNNIICKLVCQTAVCLYYSQRLLCHKAQDKHLQINKLIKNHTPSASLHVFRSYLRISTGCTLLLILNFLGE